MSLIVKIDKVCCATCQYWNGGRRLEFMNKRPYLVKVEDSARAKCPIDQNIKSGAHGTSCRGYKRWNEL